MKRYLGILAILCFGSVAAQTTQSLSANVINDSTVSIDRAIVITKIAHVKTVFLSEGVSESDAMTYFVKRTPIVDDVRGLSLFRGAIKREKVLYQKGNKLFYRIKEIPDTWEAVEYCLIIIMGVSIPAFVNGKWFHVVYVPTFVGIIISGLMNICAVRYQYTWDEMVSFIVVGFLAGILVLSIRVIIKRIQNYHLKKYDPLSGIN